MPTLTTAQAIDIKQLKETLPEAAARLREWVLECSDVDMELILKGLSVQVMASHEEIHIEGTAPIMIPEGEKLVTIVQTSACSFFDAKNNGREYQWVIAEQL